MAAARAALALLLLAAAAVVAASRGPEPAAGAPTEDNDPLYILPADPRTVRGAHRPSRWTDVRSRAQYLQIKPSEKAYYGNMLPMGVYGNVYSGSYSRTAPTGRWR